MHPKKGLTRQPRAVFLEVVVAAIDARACATARHNGPEPVVPGSPRAALMASPCSMLSTAVTRPATRSCTPSTCWSWTGVNLRGLPLSDSKAKLGRLLARKPAGIVLNEHTDEEGAVVFRHACKLGLPCG